jgi:hypothetical protein
MKRNEQQAVAMTRQNYPPGTRLELISMDDPQAIPPGSRGTVDHVDDMGTIHMRWDCGRSLGLVPGEDSFRKLPMEEMENEQGMGGMQL